jgi:hypothetical protein
MTVRRGRAMLASRSLGEIVAGYGAAEEVAGREPHGIMGMFAYCIDAHVPEWQERHVFDVAREDAVARPADTFAEPFGAEQLVRALRYFLCDFLGRHQLFLLRPDGGEFVEMARFADWLGNRGHLDPAVATHFSELARRFHGRLLRAERAAKVFRRATGWSGRLSCQPTGDLFGDYEAVRIRGQTLWLRDRWRSADLYGPVHVPGRGPGLIDEGWTLAARLYCGHGRWRLTQVRAVYPLLDEG